VRVQNIPAVNAERWGRERAGRGNTENERVWIGGNSLSVFTGCDHHKWQLLCVWFNLFQSETEERHRWGCL